MNSNSIKHTLFLILSLFSALGSKTVGGYCSNFRDSLYRKELPLYKLYLTSVTRTDEDALDLFGRNINAIENSPHRYGTTFDISWKRFYPIDADSVNQVLPERLKLVLAQVLFDLKNQKRCYVKHERKQACFHITVRVDE